MSVNCQKIDSEKVLALSEIFVILPLKTQRRYFFDSKVRSHIVYQQKDGKYKCEVWYINENGETKRITRTDPSKTAIKEFVNDYPNEEYYQNHIFRG